MIRALLFLIFLANSAFAVEPDEMLADPVLEARAQALDDQIRCVKCQSEAISSSNAEWAKTARVMVRERISAGDSDEEVIEWFVSRYGEYVRMSPQFSGSTMLLWLLAPVLLIGGILIALRTLGNKRAQADPLTGEETDRLSALMKDEA